MNDVERMLAESRATVERTKHIRAPDPIVSFESRQMRFRREADEADAARAAAKAKIRAEESADKLTASLDKLQSLLEQYVAGEIKTSRKFIMDVMAHVIAEERERMQKKIDELRAEMKGADKSTNVVGMPKKSSA